MGERKVLNKYIPADFDPALVPRGKKLSKKDGTVPVRMMLPFSIQCDTCHTFMYRGRKFNSKKEAMAGPDGRYLGIQRWRFYIKCTHCSRPVTFLTDPKNADYEMESGASRNYEVYKDKAKTEEEIANEKQTEEKIDPMKALENRVLDSQREMADLDNLEEIKAMNRRHVQLLSANGKGGDNNDDFDATTKALLMARDAKLQQQRNEVELNEHGMTEEEEALVQSIKFGQQSTEKQQTGNKIIRRLNDDDEKKLEEKRKLELEMLEKQSLSIATSTKKKSSSMLPIIKVKPKKKRSTNNEETNIKGNGNKKLKTTEITATGTTMSTSTSVKESSSSAAATATATATSTTSGGGLAGLLGDYGSDSDSD